MNAKNWFGFLYEKQTEDGQRQQSWTRLGLYLFKICLTEETLSALQIAYKKYNHFHQMTLITLKKSLYCEKNCFSCGQHQPLLQS